MSLCRLSKTTVAHRVAQVTEAIRKAIDEPVAASQSHRRQRGSSLNREKCHLETVYLRVYYIYLHVLVYKKEVIYMYMYCADTTYHCCRL